MEFKTTLEIVTKDIQDIEKLVSNFKNYSRIPNIELDLALSRLRNVYDLLLMFRDDARVGTNISAVKPSNDQPEMITKKIIPETTPIEEPPAPSAELKSESADNPAPEQISPVRTQTRKKQADEKIFINEKLGEKTIKKDISALVQGQPIKSISGSLGINDKFFFMRELFAGNAESFRQTMNDLDESRNFNEAHTLLMDKFQWDMDSEPVQMLLNLIRRKFITSGNE